MVETYKMSAQSLPITEEMPNHTCVTPKKQANAMNFGKYNFLNLFYDEDDYEECNIKNIEDS